MGKTALQPSPMESVQVVVIGFGPAGAMAANLLGKAGIRTLCIERTTEVYDKPRAIALDHEIMRMFDNIGLREEISGDVAPFDLSEHFGATGQLLRRVGMVGEPYPLGYTPTMVFTQPPVEEALRRHATSWPDVTVALGTEVVSVGETADGATVTMKDADGAESSVTAQYVIACDGASSDTRMRLDLPLEDLEFDEPWVVVDILVNPDKLHLVPANSAHFCDPERPVAYIVGPHNHRRWEIMLNEGENPREMEKPEWVWKFLSRWVTPEDAVMWRAAAYRFHALVAPKWRQGRFFLAGDAAHQQPPILGQGMCQGMRDVGNLCWKLDAVLNGGADQTLLDTYGEERREHVRDLILTIKEIGAVLCERDPQQAGVRDARILSANDGVPQTIFRQSIIPPLRAGLIGSPVGSGAGKLFPQPEVQHSGGVGLLDTVCGSGWRLVIDAKRFGVPSPALVHQANGAGVRVLILGSTDVPAANAPNLFMEKHDVLRKWFDDHQVGTAIVRPDHYVLSVSNDERELSGQLSRLHPVLRRNDQTSYAVEKVA